MATPDPTPYDSPAVFCRHLLICRTLWYDAANPDDGYSLARIVVNVRPPTGSDGQFVEPRLFAYVQLCGTVGEYEARLKLVQVTVDDAGDELERELAEWGPRLIPVTGIDLAESYALELRSVWFDGPGLYEFQFWLDGFDEPLAAERVQVPSVIEESP